MNDSPKHPAVCCCSDSTTKFSRSGTQTYSSQFPMSHTHLSTTSVPPLPHSPVYNVRPSPPALSTHTLLLSTPVTDGVVGPLHCLPLTQHTACTHQESAQVSIVATRTRRVQECLQLPHAPGECTSAYSCRTHLALVSALLY